ncbi:hypothetical protein K9L67_04800 [Candidatus Woesearchaeota archaeon]|nr:hypothetical protein [Candidatus Woesearchaeota archaeon]MCF7901519.1 hypothetical protein [Candidatus Woesearchaeota archaeon]MCF8013930.1 hypothetical protein [Candidatus Woesearchaeota archaeon]
MKYKIITPKKCKEEIFDIVQEQIYNFSQKIQRKKEDKKMRNVKFYLQEANLDNLLTEIDGINEIYSMREREIRRSQETRIWTQNNFSTEEIQTMLNLYVNLKMSKPLSEFSLETYTDIYESSLLSPNSLFVEAITPEFINKITTLTYFEQLPFISDVETTSIELISTILKDEIKHIDIKYAKEGLKILEHHTQFGEIDLSPLTEEEIDLYLDITQKIYENKKKLHIKIYELNSLINPYIKLITSYDALTGNMNFNEYSKKDYKERIKEPLIQDTIINNKTILTETIQNLSSQTNTEKGIEATLNILSLNTTATNMLRDKLCNINKLIINNQQKNNQTQKKPNEYKTKKPINPDNKYNKPNSSSDSQNQ